MRVSPGTTKGVGQTRWLPGDSVILVRADVVLERKTWGWLGEGTVGRQRSWGEAEQRHLRSEAGLWKNGTERGWPGPRTEIKCPT